jgi:hypothetical protein
VIGLARDVVNCAAPVFANHAGWCGVTRPGVNAPSARPPFCEAIIMAKLETKASRSGSLTALYCGRVRVGYIEKNGEDRFVWMLNVMQPAGGIANGVGETLEIAKASADAAFDEWLTAAGLYRF